MANITIASSASAVPAQPELYVQDGIVTTSSLQVAHFFGKRHSHVLRAIKNLLSEMPEGYAPNFGLIQTDVDLGNGGTRKTPAYRMTREGFMLLAMGFTGKEALRWKLAFIASGRDSDWCRVRYLLSFGYDRDGHPTIPQAQVVGDDQMVTSLNALIQHITKHDVLPTDAQLAALVTACAQQLSECAQIRDRRAAAKANAVAPTTTTVAAPIPPHIGSAGKPLPPGTFRAVFV